MELLAEAAQQCATTDWGEVIVTVAALISATIIFVALLR